MWSLVSLILPVLIPSWRFFKSIEPSPRVQWRLGGKGTSTGWQDVHPRPHHVRPLLMLRRLIWNPAWNEALFLISCAERIQQQPTDHSIAEIRTRILRQIRRGGIDPGGAALQFRLVFVHRQGPALVEDVVFLSAPWPIPDPATR